MEIPNFKEIGEGVANVSGQDVLMSTKEEEWGNVLCTRDTVVLRDRLMTDAALGGPRPIKAEHSYSLLTASPPPSPATPGANPYTPNSGSSSESVGSTTTNTNSTIDFVNLDHKSLDMEEECFPAISINSTSSHIESTSSPLASSTTLTVVLKRDNVVSQEDNECPEIKGEPISAPASPCAPCQSSCDMVDDKSTITILSPHTINHAKTQISHISDSEQEDESYYQSMDIEDMDVEEEYSVVCNGKEVLLSEVKQGLPPTPPSSVNSDTESIASASCSPKRRDSSTQNLRGLLAPRLYVTNPGGTHTTRQPINTPLISNQPKGSTGTLELTEEEKRTLVAEGYPVPTKLPLSKQEEKYLKKIRRKIKNKISAQESRRKKKEYLDNLENKVKKLTNENDSYKNKVSSLEYKNRELLNEVRNLQILLGQKQL
ncbi:cyclic AMP response element-binding protein A isoform X2 [Linepithema humile]|uniref:cyclic AMP response element-binding protein A isoform X2 n=1 Tax=Linepithema humile TaxID=83485 RepID=UPI00351F07CD